MFPPVCCHVFIEQLIQPPQTYGYRFDEWNSTWRCFSEKKADGQM